MSAAVRVEQYEGLVLATIDRPQARNAVDAEVARGLAVVMDLLDTRDDLRAGVVTGAGGNFCAGMDLKAFLRGEEVHVGGRGFAGMCTRPASKPLIAAVEGWALAGGCEIALACDIVVAADTARFGLPEPRRGLVAAAGGLLRLPRRVSPGAAKLLALTGEPVDGTEAHRIGLVDVLTPTGEAVARSVSIARSIVANAPLAVAASKEILDGALDRPVLAAFEAQRSLAERIAVSADAEEGAAAFVEKRAPRWRAR